MKRLYSISCAIMLVICSCKSTEELDYDNLYSFQDNFALVERGGKYGIIDTALREIIEPTLDSYIGYDLSPYFFDSWFYGIRDGSIIVYDTAGIILHHYKLDSELSPNILSDQSFLIDSFLVRTADSSYLYSGTKNWGCISSQGDTIVPFNYERIKPGLDRSTIALRGGDKNLDTHIYDFNGDRIRRTYNVPVHPWKINECYFFNNQTGLIKIWDANFVKSQSIYYEDIQVSEDYVWLKSDSLWNRYNPELKLVDGPYEKIHQNNYWGAIWKEEKVALINSKGEIITPFIYEGTISDYTSNSSFVVARNKQLLHILNANGEVIRRIVF